MQIQRSRSYLLSGYEDGGDAGRGRGRGEQHRRCVIYFFDPFIKFIIMLRIDTMLSVVYCRLSGHNVDDRLCRARTFVL